MRIEPTNPTDADLRIIIPNSRLALDEAEKEHRRLLKALKANKRVREHLGMIVALTAART